MHAVYQEVMGMELLLGYRSRHNIISGIIRCHVSTYSSCNIATECKVLVLNQHLTCTPPKVWEESLTYSPDDKTLTYVTGALEQGMITWQSLQRL